MHPFTHHEHYVPVASSDSSRRVPTRAFAHIQGGPLAPHLRGVVMFVDVPYGTEVFVEVAGLPPISPLRRNGSQSVLTGSTFTNTGAVLSETRTTRFRLPANTGIRPTSRTEITRGIFLSCSPTTGTLA